MHRKRKVYRVAEQLSPSTAMAVNKERSVKEQLVKLSKNVRNKFEDLKRSEENVERYLEASTKPFVNPIIEGIKHAIPEMPRPMIDTNQKVIKREKVAIKRPALRDHGSESVVESKKSKIEDEKEVGNVSIDASSQTEHEDLVDRYIGRLTSPAYQSRVDTTYGIRLDGHGGVLIGDSKVIFSNSHVIVQKKGFKITPGLMELLFMKVPDRKHVSGEDIAAYRNILLLTNAHRQMYSAEKPINSTRGTKYTTVISQMFPPKSKDTSGPSGSGVTDGKYNINSLVNRLRLLVLSKGAGHTAHEEEINEIIQLLRRYRVIL